VKLPIRLALRDLRGGLSGLGLLWLCLAVAIAGLASVTSLASSVDSAIAANGRQLLGGDLMLSVAQREAGAEFCRRHAAGAGGSKRIAEGRLILPSTGLRG
jgi:putative ABC transport system permease protein